MIVIVILALNWLKNRLIKTNYNDKKVINGTTEKQSKETTVLCITGFIIFGFLVVKTVIML
jgi:hypothetical protein